MTDSTKPSFPDLVRTFARVGALSFGGPAGQIALMHKEIVEDRGWVDEDAYLRALNLCHLLPGPEAQQLATWIGWRLHGVRGGLAAGLLFVIPGAVVILALSILYGYAADLHWFEALFLGVKAAVLAIVVQALIRIGRRALNTGFKRALAACAFVALFLFALPFPLVVLGAGVLGTLVATTRPDWLGVRPIAPGTETAAAPGRNAVLATVRAVLGWAAIWAAPMILIFALLGPDHVLWRIGSFFSQLAVVTFGGAYAVLAYMAQEAVQSHGWLTAREMADGLGLAETTPGPLIMVTQFVGYLAAFRAPEPFSPLVAGAIGALLTTWVTFAPCFMWIFALAPWMDRIERIRPLQAGLAAITAAVVGVIANLTVWFAIQILFTRVDTLRAGPLHLSVPDPTSLDWRVALLALTAALLLFRLHRGVLTTLAACAVGGLALSQI
jgi:chromate transporter